MYQIEEYFLMHKNEKIARFSMTDYGTSIKVLEVLQSNKMPHGTRVSERLLNEKFEEWKNDRRIPTNRPYIMQIYKKTKKTIPELETQNMGLSMSDCYWFQPVTENRKWEEVSFQNNELPDAIGKMLINVNNDTPSSLQSADVTLPGECPKMWTKMNNVLYLIKGCRMYAETKAEICNEVFASLLAERLGIDTVQYYLMRSGESIDFCCAESFIKNDAYEFVSFKQISNDTNTQGVHGVLKFMKENNMQEYLNHLIVIDYLLGNYNRTLADIGILVNSNTGEIIKPAPLFDFEESLDYNIFDEDIEGVFESDVLDQLKMVSDFSWIDFEALENSMYDIDRIFSLGGFRSSEILKIKSYFKSRILSLKKVVPPEQIKKKKKVEYVPKTPKENKPKEEPIRIHDYKETAQNTTTDTEE